MSWMLSSRRMQLLAAIVGFVLVLAPLASCNGLPNTTQGPLFGTISVPIPSQALQSPIIGPLPSNTVLHIRITLKMNQNVLNRLQNARIQPGQQSKLEQEAQKLGIDNATFQKIQQFFNTQHIAVKLSRLHTFLSVDAKAGLVAKLLQTQFWIHQYRGRKFYAPDTKRPPKAPQFLLNYIDVVTGLDNYSMPPTHQSTLSVARTTQTQQEQHTKQMAQDCQPDPNSLLPREVAHAYGFDQLWNNGLHGENMAVNLVEIDGSYRDDIQNYFDCINFQGHLNTIDVDGHPSQALGESTLDIQMVAGLARSANINVYQTNSDNNNGDIWINVDDMLQRVVDDNVNNANAGSTVSISLGAAENEMSEQDMRAIDSSFQQLTRVEHMTVFVSSGDCGAFTDGTYGDLSVSFPASDPQVVAVGGTILQIDQNSNRAQEVAWSDGSRRSSCGNRWGSGGGLSQVFNAPNWEQSVKNQLSNGRRQLPDVSAVAYGLAVYFNGQWGVVGGTSAASPIWATGLTLINQGLLKQRKAFPFSPSAFYSVAQKPVYFDVKAGNNLYYQAGPGWDYASGLGTPELPSLYAALQ